MNFTLVTSKTSSGNRVCIAIGSNGMWVFFTCFSNVSLPSSGERHALSGPISRDIAILSLRYLISRDTFWGRFPLPQNCVKPPHWYLVSHRHIRAIPHLATYRAIMVRYPIKTSTREFCDAIATTLKTVTSLNKEARLLKFHVFLSDNSIWGRWAEMLQIRWSQG